MKITDQLLVSGEYFTEVVKKEAIFIHHTAGSHRPDYTIDSWAHDRNKSGGALPVATAYVIGGISTTDKSTLFDGSIYRAFDDKYWAHHLGCTTANNRELNQKSIGIEICNYGPLVKNSAGAYINYVGKPVPAEMVGALATPWKGYSYYQKYTTQQLASLKDLLLDISVRHGIDLKKGLHQFVSTGSAGFDLIVEAQSGKPGLWTHVNVRSDKFDCWPQPELINLIKSL